MNNAEGCCVNNAKEVQGEHKYKLKHHTKVRWDSEFDLLDRCVLINASLLELYEDLEYEGTKIAPSDCNVMPKAIKSLK